MATIHDQRYIKLIEHLIKIRTASGITQATVAEGLGWEQSSISKVEAFDRRIDVIELHDWLTILGYSHKAFLEEVGWMEEAINTSLPAVPVPGKALPCVIRGKTVGTLIEMAWQGKKKEVFIEKMPSDGYLKLEAEISSIYSALNDGKGGKNREAILRALKLSLDRFPEVNPSDLYHHVVYRLYLRHYNPLLNPSGVYVKWLSNDASRSAALSEMGISGEVGGSKLDIALYGDINGKRLIFGGIHAKASLAERVSDDVPCSIAMMKRGLASYLVTLDAKSFPPPSGDLVNRGELGSPDSPSDKRNYIESHGSFSACFSYNLRTVPSNSNTISGRKIHVSTFNRQTDPLVGIVLADWKNYQARIARAC
jgi:BsaWI restriction endonuclease type 2